MKPNPPTARASAETNSVGGITYDDPYQWLETASAETLEWQTAQNDIAREYIRAWPGWQNLQDAVERATDAAQRFVFPAYHDGLWISGRDLSGASRILPGRELATVQVLDSPGGQAIETLLDLNELPHTKSIQLGGLALSPDKTLMSYSILEGGGEKPLIRIVNRSTGEVVLDGLSVVYTPPLVLGSVPTWLPDSDTLFYVALHVEAGKVPTLNLFRFHLGDPLPHRAEPLEINDPVMMLRFTHDRQYLMGMGGLVQQRPYYILDTADPDGPFVPFLKDVPGKFKGDIVGDEYICVTDDGAPRGRVIAIPLRTPADRSSWRELVVPSDVLINDVVVVGDRLILCQVVDAASRLRVIRLNGSIEGEIPLPGQGLVSTAPGTALQLFTATDTIARGEPNEIIFGFASFDQSPSLYRCDVETRKTECLLAPAARIEDLSVKRVWATSKDGARVPAESSTAGISMCCSLGQCSYMPMAASTWHSCPLTSGT